MKVRFTVRGAPVVREYSQDNSIASTASHNSNAFVPVEEESMMDGDTATISSGSSGETRSNGTTTPGCTKGGDAMNLENVAVESIRALALSAWMVGETVVAVGSHLAGQMPNQCYQCTLDNSVNTSIQQSASNSKQNGSGPGKRFKANGAARGSATGANETSQKKRRFSIFGRSKAKKNSDNGSRNGNTTSSETQPSHAVSNMRILPKKPASLSRSPKRNHPKVTTPPRSVPVMKNSPRTVIDNSPSRPNRLKQLACFAKRPVDDHEYLNSRYRTEHEGMQLSGGSSIYTIRMSRVPSAELDL